MGILEDIAKDVSQRNIEARMINDDNITADEYADGIIQLLKNDNGNVSVNIQEKGPGWEYKTTYTSRSTYKGKDGIEISFRDEDNDPTTFESVRINFRGSAVFTARFEDLRDIELLTKTAQTALNVEKAELIDRISRKGGVRAEDVTPSDLKTLLGRKSDGSPRKIAVIIPHQDDEVGIAGTLSYYIKEYGAENIMVLFTTNGDGLKWDAPAAEREKYGRTKMRMGLEACHKLGIPMKNVRLLGTSEFEFYNSFISNNLKADDLAGKPRPKDVQDDFRYIDDPLQALYYQTEWIYRNLADFGADVVITSDVEYTVQMHDWTGIMTRLAVNQYAREHRGGVLQLAFAQQNVNPKVDDKLLYSYYPDQIMQHGAMRVVLDEEMKKAKSGTISNYQRNATDGLLFVKYFFQFGPTDTANMKKYESLHIVNNEDLNFSAPPLDEQGYPVFEGNDNHLGIPHSWEDDYRALQMLIEYIKEHPLTPGDIEPFKSSLWYGKTE